MKIILAVLVIVVANVTGSAQWQKDNKKLEDTAERKSVKGFAAHLLVIRDPNGFIEEWSKPEMPTIKPVREVKQGDILGVIILFAGCKPDSGGVCNCQVDYVVLKPDGTVYGEHKEKPLWKEQAPPALNIQLGRALVGIRMEPKDPVGEYKVKAKVSDLNADVSFELETKFRLN